MMMAYAFRAAATRCSQVRPQRLALSICRRYKSTDSGANTFESSARWSLRLAHDNTFLSYHRNALICAC